MVVTRDSAIRIGVRQSPRNQLTTADSTAAVAALAVARQFENPVLSASYSKSTPSAHFALDIPVDWRRARSPRVRAAEASLDAAVLRVRYDRATITLDIDTTYTRLQALDARSQLSARTARDADSLFALARERRDAGDASDLDVELARIFAGQSANAALSDSLSAQSVRLSLQALLAAPIDQYTVVLADSLLLDGGTRASPAAITAPAVDAMPGGATLLVAASDREFEAATARVLVEQRRRVLLPSLSVGFEAINPGGQKGPLPTFGIALPLPLLNRNAPAIALANSERDRAGATFSLARIESTRQLNAAARDAAAALARATRSMALVTSANRVATLSLLAYREGASTLVAAMEAQRTAREVIAQYVDDAAAACIANSVLRLYSLAETPR